jgi:UDP-4-amino-4,6-dideoxy-N-acetyl-beta-L-altrosamine transaminase
MISYGRQTITEDDIDAVVRVLKSDFLTQGECVPAFERSLALYCGVKYAVAVSNGTAALHIACLASGVTVGDRVWTCPISFVASANCARFCGAEVDFVDIDSATGCMSAEALEKKLAWAAQAGRLPKLVIPVHYAGQSCDMERIFAACEKYGVRLIEDACHALGGSYKGRRIGSCQYSGGAVFSFHPVKSITTGEGGALVTNDPEMYRTACLLRSHGISRPVSTVPTWEYSQDMLGYNYRMTDIQAALGDSQLLKLNGFIERRRAIDDAYRLALRGLPLDVLEKVENSESSCHLFVVKLHNESRRSAVFAALRKSGIGANVHYIPIHLQPYYSALGFSKGDYPESEDFYSRIITLPVFPALSRQDQEYVINTLSAVLRGRS